MTERLDEQDPLEGRRRALARGGEGRRLPLQRVRKASSRSPTGPGA